MRSWIPNSITLFNLFCGCAAIINLINLELTTACWFLLAAALADFADGLAARLLGVSSLFGKELDSLADMVSFGLVPGVIYYVLLWIGNNSIDLSPVSSHRMAVGWDWAAAPGLLVTLFSALRLAKFNLDERQTSDFIGLATPSSTVYAAGLLLILTSNTFGWSAYILSPWLIYPSILLMSFLLVSEIPMFSFKLKHFRWVGNRKRYIFAAAAVLLLVLLQQSALPFIIILYLIINLADRLFSPSA